MTSGIYYPNNGPLEKNWKLLFRQAVCFVEFLLVLLGNFPANGHPEPFLNQSALVHNVNCRQVVAQENKVPSHCGSFCKGSDLARQSGA